MSASLPASSTGSDDSRGFTKRAARIVSNAALYDLVQDMAGIVDTVPPRLDRIEAALDLLLAKFGLSIAAD